jgi:GTP cyclohydrolase I
MSDRAEQAIRDFLEALGFSEDSPELQQTPARVAALFRNELLDGYRKTPEEIFRETFPSKGSSLVSIEEVDFHSICPHHLLPVLGVARIAYLPAGQVAGFSQIVELVECLAHRFTLQEDLGTQLATTIAEQLRSPFVACELSAYQLCMMIRGARRPRSRVTTYAFAGTRSGDPMLKELFLQSSGKKILG